MEKSPHSGYASCGFPQFLASDAPESLFSGPPAEELAQKRGFVVKTGADVNEIHPTKRLVTFVKEGKERTIKYSALVLATGAQPIVPKPFKPAAANVFTLRNFYDALTLKKALGNSSKSVLIVGAGLLGLELADALYQRRHDVSVIEQSERIFPKYFEEISGPVSSNVQSSGVKLLKGVSVQIVNTAGNLVESVSLSNGSEIRPEIIILATGIEPRVDLAIKARIPLGSTGAIAVNSLQETRRQGVYAAGDCCESRNVVCKKNMWLPYAGIAAKQGRVVGSNLAGKRTKMPLVAGTAMAKVFGLECGRTGLDWEQAHKAGFDPEYCVIHQKAKPEYVATSAEVTVALIGDKRSKRILGGQIVAEGGAGFRLNIVATALTAEMTVDQLEYMDFGYTPEINPLWDPLAIAANLLGKKMKRG